jgi:hypothetical protein
MLGALEPKADTIASTQRAHEHPGENHKITVVSGALAAHA